MNRPSAVDSWMGFALGLVFQRDYPRYQYLPTIPSYTVIVHSMLDLSLFSSAIMMESRLGIALICRRFSPRKG